MKGTERFLRGRVNLDLHLLQKFPRRGDYEEVGQILLRAFVPFLACLVPGSRSLSGGKVALSVSLQLLLSLSSPYWASLARSCLRFKVFCPRVYFSELMLRFYFIFLN